MSDLPYLKQAQEIKITGQDATGITSNFVQADINGNLSVRDAISSGSQYRSMNATTTAAEATGAASRLANRKFIMLTPTTGTIYIGTDSSVTTANGTPVTSGQTLFLSFTDSITVFMIAASTIDVRVLEGK